MVLCFLIPDIIQERFQNEKYNEEFKQKIISEYNNGKTKSQIRKEYNIPFSTMNHWFNNQNSIFVGNVKYSEDIVNNVLNDYSNGYKIEELSNKYKIKTGTIYKWIKDNNISRDKGPKSLCENKTYFDDIDEELKAYFLGYIVADGNVSITNGQYALKITLQYRDRYIIEKLLTELHCSNKIRDFYQKSPTSNNTYRYSYVSIGNKHLVEALINLNVVPSKTFKEVIPNIKEEMLPHFIRGFFDGDGIACRTEKTYSFGFVGNKIILDQLKNILEWNNSLNPHVITNVEYIHC